MKNHSLHHSRDSGLTLLGQHPHATNYTSVTNKGFPSSYLQSYVSHCKIIRPNSGFHKKATFAYIPSGPLMYNYGWKVAQLPISLCALDSWLSHIAFQTFQKYYLC